MSTKADIRISYEATIERRAGELFAVVERTTDETPISNRGREWAKSSYHRTVQVVPFKEVAQLMGALTQALAWAVSPSDGEDGVLDRGDEPSYGLFEERVCIGRYWSAAEAREAGDSYIQGDHVPADSVVTVRVLPGDGLGDVVMVIERRK